LRFYIKKRRKIMFGRKKIKMKLEEKKEFLKKYAKKHTISEICEKLNVSYDKEKKNKIIKKFLEKNNISYRKRAYANLTIEEIKFLYENEHQSLSKISKITGINAVKLSKQLKDIGVEIKKTNTSYITPSEAQEIKEMLDAGKKVYFIAKYFGFNYNKAKRIVGEIIEEYKD